VSAAGLLLGEWVIDQLMEGAEDFADIAAADLAWSEVAAGAQTISLEDLAAELGR
jgi:hypothetical protein